MGYTNSYCDTCGVHSAYHARGPCPTEITISAAEMAKRQAEKSGGTADGLMPATLERFKSEAPWWDGEYYIRRLGDMDGHTARPVNVGGNSSHLRNDCPDPCDCPTGERQDH